MRIGFFVWEYPPQLVGGLGTYAEYITQEFVDIGHDVSVFTLNKGDLKTRDVFKGVEIQMAMHINHAFIIAVSKLFPDEEEG